MKHRNLYTHAKPPRPPRKTLTPRETEVLRVAVKTDDTRDKHIADLMGLATRTVETHFTNIRVKLHVHTKYAAMLKFLQMATLPILLLLALSASGSEATLNIERRGSDVVLWVSGGTSNVQYQIYTSPDNTVNNTNWYYWRRAYSKDFLTPGQGGEMVVYYPTHPTPQPRRFFQIRGVLPD